MITDKRTILVTGPTGYIGGRLIPRLLAKGYAVRCLARHPDRLADKPWANLVEIVWGDVYKDLGLKNALQGVSAAYYLVHSMADVPGFEEMEAASARNFAAAAAASGCKRVVYLGGLGSDKTVLSKHLASRHKVGAILRAAGLEVTEFRAGIIVGSGSVSFEMIRYLVERLPVIPACRCLSTCAQPLAIRDALAYLINCLDKPETAGKVIEIGGPQRYRYSELLKIYAGLRGLKRWFIDLSNWDLKLSSTMVGLITPVPKIFAKPLMESLSCEVTCDDTLAKGLFPEIKPIEFSEAVKLALQRISDNEVETSWTASYTPSYSKAYSFEDKEGMISHAHVLDIAAPPGEVYRVFTGIGGGRGWFYGHWLWWLKAVQDRLVGGIGMRRGRRHPDVIHQGEPLDSWRVELIVKGRMMLLRAEMRLPGKGWLEFSVVPREAGSTLRLTAYFEPHGLLGNIYWYGLYPAHVFIFRGLALEIKRMAEAGAK